MRITFLGTAAAELYPGVWCQCDYCSYARKHGGRNIRFNSAIHFAEKCLVDLPPDTVNGAIKYGIDLLATELLLCTHSHGDHFHPSLLQWRYRVHGVDSMSESDRAVAYCARFGDLPQLRIFGNRKVFEKLSPFLLRYELADHALDFTIVEAYHEYSCAGVDFIPMIASHVDANEERGLIYLIGAQGKTFLYATDSGTYTDRTRDCIRAHKVDAVIMECTYGQAEKGGGHMSFSQMEAEVRFFIESGVFTGAPRVYLTHLSPHRTPPYDQLSEALNGTCISSAYDGMVLDL